MNSKLEPGADLLELAESRAGVLTAADLRTQPGSGSARRRWVSQWQRMCHGVYCITEPTWKSWCWAGALRGGETGVISGAAAGHLHGFVTAQPSQIVVYHQRTEGMAPIGDGAVGVKFRRGPRTGSGMLRKVPVEMALIDLARDATADEAVAAVTRTLSQGLSTAPRILEALDQRQRVRHRKVMEELCQDSSAGVESVLEWKFLQQVIRAHGLPEPERQLVLLPGRRHDVGWQAFALVVELDGRLGHEDKFRDMGRDNDLATIGVLVLRYGWDDVTALPCQVARQLAKVLASRGWDGTLTPCVECGATSAPLEWG